MTERSSDGVADTVATARTLFDIVEFLKENDGATITEVAASLGYAKSTVHRHLSTLKHLGYVVEDGNGHHVGLRFLQLGWNAQNRHTGYKLAREKVEEIAEKTGERVQFIVEEHGKAVYVYRALGEHAVHTDPGLGSRIPLHATSAGKAILANLPEKRRFEITEQEAFEPITDATITDPDELFEELAVVREQGYSFNIQENLDGLHSVGVPIRDSDGVIGALSLSGPSHRLKGERFETELPDLLLGAANELELNIAHL